MAAIAAFAASDHGRFHWMVSQASGADPAAGMSDPVEAANLRAALFVMSQRERPTPQDGTAMELEDGRRIVHNPGLGSDV